MQISWTKLDNEGISPPPLSFKAVVGAPELLEEYECIMHRDEDVSTQWSQGICGGLL